VRDVADAHIEAMTSEAAGANRTIVATDPLSLIDVAAVLRERLPEASGKIPRRAMTTWLTWVASVFEPQLRDIRWLIGSAQRFDHDPDEVLLGHFLRSPTRSRRSAAASPSADSSEARYAPDIEPTLGGDDEVERHGARNRLLDAWKYAWGWADDVLKLIEQSVDEAAQRLMVGGFGPAPERDVEDGDGGWGDDGCGQVANVVTFEGGGGSEIVRQLIESGQEVVELARSEAAEQSRHIRIEWLARLLITIDLSMAEAARSIGWPIPTTPAAPSTPTTGVSHRRAACQDVDGCLQESGEAAGIRQSGRFAPGALPELVERLAGLAKTGDDVLGPHVRGGLRYAPGDVLVGGVLETGDVT
jgi:hypothetical protein